LSIICCFTVNVFFKNTAGVLSFIKMKRRLHSKVYKTLTRTGPVKKQQRLKSWQYWVGRSFTKISVSPPPPMPRSKANYNSKAEAKRTLQPGQEKGREHKRTPYKERQKNKMPHNRHKRQEKQASNVSKLETTSRKIHFK
jgi:hypothetical protein